jgi:ribonucleoside-diphosphate reductase alpha chain
MLIILNDINAFLGNLIETGMYYLRTKAAVDAIKFTLNNDKKAEPIEYHQRQLSQLRRLKPLSLQ